MKNQYIYDLNFIYILASYSSYLPYGDQNKETVAYHTNFNS